MGHITVCKNTLWIYHRSYDSGDVGLMYFYPEALHNTLYYYHHAILIIGATFIGCGAPFAYFMFVAGLNSLSDPLLSVRWFLTTTGYDKRSRIYIGNAVLFTTVFFFCRIVAIPVNVYLFLPTWTYK